MMMLGGLDEGILIGEGKRRVKRRRREMRRRSMKKKRGLTLKLLMCLCMNGLRKIGLGGRYSGNSVVLWKHLPKMMMMI